MTSCPCAGAAHLVCRPSWKRATFPRLTLPRYRAGDVSAWVAGEVQKLGAVPPRFRYTPPHQAPDMALSWTSCPCRGRTHVVCLPARSWREWLTAAQRFLDCETPKPEEAADAAEEIAA